MAFTMLVTALKERFPLHYIVFKQAACHLPHEVCCPAPPPSRATPHRPLVPSPTLLLCCALQANAEELFSRAGNLSDPHMDAHFLSVLTSIGKNKQVYKPSVSAIKEKYYTKYRGGASSSEAVVHIDSDDD